MMKNPFFRIALTRAARIAGKPGLLLQLVTRMIHELCYTDRTQLSLGAFRDRLHTLGRLVASYARGHYRAIPLRTLLSAAAALVYFLNPIDLVPDALLGLGLTDDLAVLTWVYHSTQEEVNRFLLWEESGPNCRKQS